MNFFPADIGYTAFRRDRLRSNGNKPFFIASYYKPHELHLNSILEFEKSLDLARNLKGTKLILGDFNCPQLNWDSDHTPTYKAGRNTSSAYDKFLNIVEDHNLVQMVNENTQSDNMLHLFLISVHPG